jgi:hypothetical protein
LFNVGMQRQTRLTYASLRSTPLKLKANSTNSFAL